MRLAVWVFLVSAAALALATAPSFHVFDSAELTGAGVRLGLSHPPGQAAHALLVKAVTLLPLGDLAFRANLLSALAAAAAGMLMVLACLHLGVRPLVALAAAGGVVLPFSVVEHATRAEVYTPGLALAVLSLSIGQTSRGVRSSACAGLAAGLAWTLHPAAGIAAGLGRLAAWDFRKRPMISFVAGIGVGLVPLVYVVVRGAKDALPIWDPPRTVESTVAFLSGAGYSRNVRMGDALAGLADAGQIVLHGGGWLLPIAAIATAARERNRPALLLLGAGFLSLAPVAPLPFVAENPDLWGYTTGALALVAFAFARCAARLPDWAAAIVLASTLLLGGGPGRARPHARMAQALVEETLEALPPRALYVADSDHVFGALAYLSAAEGFRPDVAWIASGLAGQEAPWPRVSAHDVALRGQPRFAPVPGDPRDRMIVALLHAARGRVPCTVEDARFLPGAPSAGGAFSDDAGPSRDEWRWARIARERRGDSTEEGIVRGAMLALARGLALRGEARSAARALLVGLADPPPTARRIARSVPRQTALRPDLAVEQRTFDPDDEVLFRALVRLAGTAGP